MSDILAEGQISLETVEDGEDGRGISSTAVSYAKSNDGNTAPTSGWQSAIPPLTDSEPYLWTKTHIVYTSGSPASTDIYTVSKKGEQGSKGDDGKMLYATSSTGATTAAKVATITPAVSSLVLYSGITVTVTFTSGNTASSPSLNINNTGAKNILTNGINSAYWSPGTSVVFTYDGTYWQVASTPVYADTVTVGNANGNHVHIGNSGFEIMNGNNVLSSFSDTEIHLGNNNNTNSVIYLCNTDNKLSYQEDTRHEPAADADVTSKALALNVPKSNSPYLEKYTGIYSGDYQPPESGIEYGTSGYIYSKSYDYMDNGNRVLKSDVNLRCASDSNGANMVSAGINVMSKVSGSNREGNLTLYGDTVQILAFENGVNIWGDLYNGGEKVLTGNALAANSYIILGAWKIAWGTVSITADGTDRKTKTISLNFSVTPYVFVTPLTTYRVSANVNNVSATSATIGIWGQSTLTQSITVRWFAIGRVPN